MIKLKELLKENMKPRWSAVVLDDKSKNTLINSFKTMIPDGWEVLCHHCTINPFGLIDNVGQSVKLKITHIGKNNTALAVKVSGYNGKTNNAFPHITIAIDRANGGKPKDSNSITNWQPITSDIYLSGTTQNL
jgi:hypothetical protein